MFEMGRPVFCPPSKGPLPEPGPEDLLVPASRVWDYGVSGDPTTLTLKEEDALLVSRVVESALGDYPEPLVMAFIPFIQAAFLLGYSQGKRSATSKK